MVVFHYFWDRAAGLLIVSCALPEGVKSALVVVSRSKFGDLAAPLAAVPVQVCERLIKSTFAVPAPSDDEDSVETYEFVLVCDGTPPVNVSLSDSIILDSQTAVQFPDCDAVNWSIHDGSSGPVLSLSLPGDNVEKDGLLSRVLVSRRDGERLAPGSLGNGAGEGAAVLVQTDWKDPATSGGRGHVVELFLTPILEAHVGVAPTALRVHSLMAGGHVRDLIEKPGHVIDVEQCNFAQLRLDNTILEATAEFPKIGVAPGDPSAFPLGLMDRIVITSQPPAQFWLLETADVQRQIGSDGVAVLFMDPNGRFRPDEGALLRRMIDTVNQNKYRDDFDLFDALSHYGLSVSRADVAKVADVSVLVVAEVRARLSGLPPALRPSGVVQFCTAPQFFGCLAADVYRRLSAESLASLQGSARPTVEERCGTLGRLLVESQFDMDGENDPDDFAEGSRLRLWVASGKGEGLLLLAVALSERLQNFVEYGISPEWHEIGILATQEPTNLNEYQRHLNLLTKANVLAFTPDLQFNSLSGCKTALVRMRRLTTKVVAFLRKLDAEFGRNANLPAAEEDVLDIVANVRIASDGSLLPMQSQLEDILWPRLPFEIEDAAKEAFLRRISRLFLPGFRQQHQNVGGFGAAAHSSTQRVRELAEPPAVFRRDRNLLGE